MSHTYSKLCRSKLHSGVKRHSLPHAERHRAEVSAAVLLGQTEAIWGITLCSVHRQGFVRAVLHGNMCLDLSWSSRCEYQSGTPRKDLLAASTNSLAILSG